MPFKFVAKLHLTSQDYFKENHVMNELQQKASYRFDNSDVT